MTKIFLNTLYVGTEGTYLRLENDQIIIELPETENAPPEKKTVPLHHIGAITLFGRVNASIPLMTKCAEEGRAFTFMTEYGRFLARIQGKTSGNVLLRRDQYNATQNLTQSLPITQAIVAAKVQNARQVLLRAIHDQNPNTTTLQTTAQSLAQFIQQIPNTRTLDEVRGIEGIAAKSYFDSFDSLILQQRTHFKFTVRSRRPPRDRTNCLLSFLYSLYTNDCNAALEGVGLDPQFGFLHTLRPGRQSLALDLVEEFRPIILDRLCLTLINRKQITPKDFLIRKGESVTLTDEGRKKLLVAYQNRKKAEVPHPLLKEPVPIGLLPHLQARLLARHIRGDIPQYPPYQP